MKPIMTLAKIAPAGKCFALAVPVVRAGLTGFSLLEGAENRSTTRGPLDAKRAKFPAEARVTVVLIDGEVQS